MNIFDKLMTAVRGGVTEAGEAIVDTQALRILDQEVRDAAEELKQSKTGLANIIAKQKLAAEKAANVKADIEENEGYALKALEMDNSELAHQVAGKIADLEVALNLHEESSASFGKSAEDLRTAVAAAERDIASMKQQIDTVKATESVQRAQAAVSERHSGTDSKLTTAMESLQRIKERQAERSAQMNAAKELSTEYSETSLNQKLEEAGIKSSSASADDVLARLKKQQAS